MIVEDADRFGLSQLHQLRGRVGRGEKAAEMHLVSASKSDAALTRLSAMVDTDDGFELASYDLSLRREGDILGNRQHGASGLKLVNVMRDGAVIEAAHADAAAILEEDPNLELPVHSARGGFDDAVVLDAFAGSGALGLEALSRGARSVQFCERGGEALRALNANVRLLGLDARRARVRKGDVLKDVPYARPPFDLVFLDPPYACAAAEVLGLVVALRTRAALSDDAIVVYEHASAANDEVEEAAKARDLSIAQRKKYGDTVVDVLRATALHDAID